MGRADELELRRAVTDQSPQNLLTTRDAAQLGALHSDLAGLLCGIARIPEVGHEEALNKEALNEEALNEEALNEAVLNEEVLNEEALTKDAFIVKL